MHDDPSSLIHQTDIERAIGAPQIETVSIHPEKPLYEACRMMLASRARRIPLIDIDDETRRAMVVSVVTQYRILKFVAVNVKETQQLQKPLKEMNVGTYENLQTATMDTPVIEVIHMLVKKNISSVPILDKEGESGLVSGRVVANKFRDGYQRVRVGGCNHAHQRRHVR